ncbi:MAG: NAD(P)H-dependent oxidoreductase [Cyanobacteria bacterium REEB67]|nr:NAD(P)H-dependent oxidoreductase [Cyanobacteria bacterium REEB67]
MKILIVHAHHEPKSFCSALRLRAKEQLEKDGHEVILSDLHALNFDPVSDRRNFTTVKDATYLKQQQEEMYASDAHGFAADLEAEIKKLEECDALIFSFPLWWFGMPAILKGWCDRVLAMGRIYGGGKFFENGLGEGKRRAMLIATTGGGANAYDGWGLNPPLDELLKPIQHGIFWFNGFQPLEPFIAYSASRIGDSEREKYLTALTERMAHFTKEVPLIMPLLADYPNWGPDNKGRFQIVVSRIAEIDDKYKSLIQAEADTIKKLKREGVLTDFQMSALEDPDWRAFFKMRGSDKDEIQKHLEQFPLASYLKFEITKLTHSF